jgi:hypothetical protein
VADRTCPVASNRVWNKFIVVMAPGLRCCECGGALRPGLCGVCTRVPSMPFHLLFFVCGRRCQNIGLQHLAWSPKQVHAVSAKAVRRLLDLEDKVAGFAQGRLAAGVVIVEPYRTSDPTTSLGSQVN